MDTSKQYILMCEKAEEIQALRPKLLRTALNKIQRKTVFDSMLMNHFGDGICCDGYSGNWWFSTTMGIPVWNTAEDEFIWLIRQDQLQEMLTQLDGEDLRIFDLAEHHKIDAFHQFVFPDENLGVMPHKTTVERVTKQMAYVSQFKTQEQLWLAFVMFERFSKQWSVDKKEWFKNDERLLL